MPVQIVQAQAIILVCLFHAQLYLTPLGLAADSNWILLRIFGFILMPVLFLTAGMSMSRSETPNFRRFALVRISSYLWLYFIWHTLYQIPDTVKLLEGRVDFVTWMQKTILSFAGTAGTLWFIYYL